MNIISPLFYDLNYLQPNFSIHLKILTLFKIHFPLSDRTKRSFAPIEKVTKKTTDARTYSFQRNIEECEVFFGAALPL